MRLIKSRHLAGIERLHYTAYRADGLDRWKNKQFAVPVVKWHAHTTLIEARASDWERE